MSEDNAYRLGHNELNSFVSVLDVATLAANGSPFVALADLARLVDTDTVQTLGTVVGFLGASIKTLAEISGKTVDEMAADLRRNGAL